MDFSVYLDGVDYFGASEAGVFEPKSYESGGCFMKNGRPFEFLDNDCKALEVGSDYCSKMLKREDLMHSKPMLLQTRPTILRSEPSFAGESLGLSSLTKANGLHSTHDSLQTATLPSCHSSYTETSVLSSGSLNGDVNGVLAGVRGPFTPSQRLELAHQALIFKYITAGVPIPLNLLLSIRRAMNPSPLYAFSAASLRPNALGWGPFHLGFSGNLDPERGRCRRTDGKKWRCSRDAVADQKYCERHMNRGRHRSRKPVEGQTGQATAGTAAAAASKAASVVAPSSKAPVHGNAPDSLANTQHQIKTFHQPADSNFSSGGRFLINKPNVEDRMGNPRNNLLLSSVNLKERESSSPLKQQFTSHEWSRTTGFSLIPSDSLVSNGPRHSYSQSKNFGLSSDLNAREPQQENPFRHFIDEWPKIDEIRAERTQLSASIPNQEKLGLSSLKAREMDPIEMGLGMGTVNDSSDKQTNWEVPTWETSLGGPLAEVLSSTNKNASCKNSSALNLMNQDWGASSPVDSSPTGVLMETAFCWHSNSSAGSSPRAETNKVNDSGLPDNTLGSNLVNSTTMIQC